MPNEMKKIFFSPPECYSFLKEDAERLVDHAFSIPLKKHMARLEACKARVNRREYAVGGETLHRGFLCPSPVQDIVIGNNSRGRMVKSLAHTKRKLDYGYGFCDDQLLTVMKNVGDPIYTIEYLHYVENRQIGYQLNQFGELNHVSECIYQNGMLGQYLEVHLMADGAIYSTKKEVYEYHNGLLQSAVCYDAFACFCTHGKYLFEHDSDGFLSSYQSTEYKENQENEDFYWKGHVFQVSKKRKV